MRNRDARRADFTLSRAYWHSPVNDPAIHATTALARLAQAASDRVRADLLLIDVGPNLGALNRAARLAADCLALLKRFASLVPFAQQARKPIFDLKQADGVGGQLRRRGAGVE